MYGSININKILSAVSILSRNTNWWFPATSITYEVNLGKRVLDILWFEINRSNSSQKKKWTPFL